MRAWINLARSLAFAGACAVAEVLCWIDDRRSARKIARLTEIVEAQITQTVHDLCDMATMLILDIEDYLASVWEIDQLEALYRAPCRRGRA